MFYPVGGTKKKGALLASSGFQYAILKLFCEETDREKIPFEMKAFRSYLEAKAWLMGSSENPVLSRTPLL